jgi:EAL domain-containing protein (putative c-di-GMP-specific phosphodiesterase class I)
LTRRHTAGKETVLFVKLSPATVCDAEFTDWLRGQLKDTSLRVLWECGVQFIQGNFLQTPSREMDFLFNNQLVERKSTARRAAAPPVRAARRWGGARAAR